MAPRPSRSRGMGTFSSSSSIVPPSPISRRTAACRCRRTSTRDADAGGPRALPDGLCAKCRAPSRRRRRACTSSARRLRNSRVAGIAIERLTLHVGAGTFHAAASRRDRRASHARRAHSAMPSGDASPPSPRRAARGGRVVAVGTTVVRTLEAAAAGRPARGRLGRDGHLHPARTPLPRGRCAADELPPAGIDAAGTRRGLRGTRARARRLSSRHRRRATGSSATGMPCS